MASVSTSISQGEDCTFLFVTVWKMPTQEQPRLTSETVAPVTHQIGAGKMAHFSRYLFALHPSATFSATVEYKNLPVAKIRFRANDVEVEKTEFSKQLNFRVYEKTFARL